MDNGNVTINVGGQVLTTGPDCVRLCYVDPAGIPDDTEFTDDTYYVQAGSSTIVDGETLWIVGEGPARVQLTSVAGVMFDATLHLRASGGVVTVHASQDLIDAAVSPTPPAAAVEITGEQGTDDTAILAALLAALDGQGLIVDSTTTGE